MRSLRSLHLPTTDEEVAWARAIEAGVLAARLLVTGERPVPATDAELSALVEAGHRARQRFLLGYVRLVAKLAAAEAKRCGLNPEDLCQEGFVALCDTLQRFDHTRCRFSTYATMRVGQHLAEVGAARLGDLAIPASRALRLRRARGVAAALGQEQQRTVGAAEVAAAVGASARDMSRLLAYRAPVPVDVLAEAIPDPDPVDPDAGIYAEQFGRLVARLEPTQAEIVRLRYGLVTGEQLDVQQTARLLGLSESSVRRLERKALAALRPMLEATPAGRYYREPPARWTA
ncbi:MAG TPA: sigma-70 family RNA polymerase sigma factor [Propionicimonas sp.]|nr:sigma-70 family RNA polymerase sigma factor [Propionicimonas sp.]HQA77733.1 sigma-70 family RNA polymerase sigma factor [Propionicimonas sp.]HQD96966.1 sigma-70 family RNA polymerase sigma factor [Propionicimonas sp.]